MSDRPPNQVARVAAVSGVILMFLLAVVVIATAGGGDDSGSGSDNGSDITTVTGPDTSDPRIERAIENGIYVVQEGDTFTSIAEATGVDVETLQNLNPMADPQVLVAGTHLKLR